MALFKSFSTWPSFFPLLAIFIMMIITVHLSLTRTLPNSLVSEATRFCDLGIRCVYDIGHNNGQDTEFYLKDIGNRVVAVEANPGLIRESRWRFKKEIEQGRLILIWAGLGREEDVNRSMTFWINNNDKFSSFHEELGCRDGYGKRMKRGDRRYCKRVNIGMTTCARLVETFGKGSYMKVDIEGLDRSCVESLERIDKELRPKYMSVENVHEKMMGSLRRLGYDGFKVVNQLKLQLNTNVMNRGRSGAWGEDAIDERYGKRWMKNEADVLEGLISNGSAWYDLHARMGLKRNYYSN